MLIISLGQFGFSFVGLFGLASNCCSGHCVGENKRSWIDSCWLAEPTGSVLSALVCDFPSKPRCCRLGVAPMLHVIGFFGLVDHADIA